MSLTIGEANAINTLLSALTGEPYGSGVDLPDEDQVVEAATLLAARAHRTLGAGWDGPAAALAVEQTYAADAPAIDTAVDGDVAAWQLAAAAAIVDQRLDRDGLVFDGAEWATEALDGAAYGADEVLLTHQSGRQAVVRVAVEVVEGALT